MTPDTHTTLYHHEAQRRGRFPLRARSQAASGNRSTDRGLPTRQECYLADEQPAVGEVELAPEDLSRPGPQREGDGSGGGVLQIFQGHVQSERRRPRLEDPRFKLAFHLIEDSDTLSVTVVAVHLEKRVRRKDGEG